MDVLVAFFNVLTLWLFKVTLFYSCFLITNLKFKDMKKVRKEQRTSTRYGYYKDENTQKFTEGVIHYLESNQVIDKDTLGVPITISVAKTIIHNYWEKTNNEGNKDDIIACKFGKEILLSILSQNDCNAIRFYFGWKKASDYPNSTLPSGVIEGITLVAVGVRINDSDIATDKDYIVSDFVNGTSIGTDKSEDIQGGMISEMVPPLTLGKVKDDSIKGLVADPLAKIIKKFFKI
jgi:hypothetical protein